MLKLSELLLVVFNMALQKNQSISPPSDLKEENDVFNGVWMQTVLHFAENQGHKTNESKLYVMYIQRSKPFQIFCKEKKW